MFLAMVPPPVDQWNSVNWQEKTILTVDSNNDSFVVPSLCPNNNSLSLWREEAMEVGDWSANNPTLIQETTAHFLFLILRGLLS